jgi:hypothetical protein
VPSCMGCAILRNYHCSPLMGASNKGFTNWETNRKNK